MKDHETPGSSCPVCAAYLDAVCSPYTDKPPKEGDLTICAYCATLLQIGPQGESRLFEGALTKEEQEDIDKLVQTLKKIQERKAAALPKN